MKINIYHNLNHKKYIYIIVQQEIKDISNILKLKYNIFIYYKKQNLIEKSF